MKYKIGIFGSSSGSLDKVLPKAQELGQILGNHSNEVIVVTGACSGLPYVVANEANKAGAEVWGFSNMIDQAGLTSLYPDQDTSIYTKLIYVPKDYPFVKQEQARMKYRNVSSTATVDGGIIISGRWGSLNEFTNLIDMHKAIGVLTGTGGIADELPRLVRKIKKEGQLEVTFSDNPKKLVEKLLQNLERSIEAQN